MDSSRGLDVVRMLPSDAGIRRLRPEENSNINSYEKKISRVGSCVAPSGTTTTTLVVYK